MRKQGRIRIIGAIDEDMVKHFSKNLASHQRNGVTEVKIELSSGGGTALDAIAIVSLMRLSNVFFEVLVVGAAYSAAVLILAAGDKRMMAKEAWVMIHEDSGRIKGDIVTMEREAKHYRRMETQWTDLMEEYTGTPAATWSTLHKATTYMNAQECLTYGLIDKVV